VHFDAVAVSGANEYRVKPWALVTTVTPLTFAVFSAAPDPAAPGEAGVLDGAPYPALPLEDELHAAAVTATAATPAAARILIRIDVSFLPGLACLRPGLAGW
jgi:hypothetical protein